MCHVDFLLDLTFFHVIRKLDFEPFALFTWQNFNIIFSVKALILTLDEIFVLSMSVLIVNSQLIIVHVNIELSKVDAEYAEQDEVEQRQLQQDERAVHVEEHGQRAEKSDPESLAAWCSCCVRNQLLISFHCENSFLELVDVNIISENFLIFLGELIFTSLLLVLDDKLDAS